MNRAIVICIAIFAGIVASTFLWMHGGSSPTSPDLATIIKPADGDSSLAKGKEGKALALASASVPAEEKAPGAKSVGDPDAKTKEAQEPPEKPVIVEGPPSKPKKPKRGVAQRPPEAPKPAAPKPVDTSVINWDEDLGRLQGTWRMVDTEYDGNRIAEEARNYSWEFRGDKYTIKRQGNFMELHKVQLNSERSPKTIDGTHDITGRKVMGIYELTEDTLKVCYDLTGNGRPDSFTAARGSRRVCYYFER
jgi:uncharacterized protein (TIGR03067 family)